MAGNLLWRKWLLAGDGRRKADDVVALFNFLVGERLEIHKIRFRIDLVKLQRHLHVKSFLVLLADANVERIENFPFVVERFHCTVNFEHDIVGLRLRTDAEMPLGSFDGRAAVLFLPDKGGDCLISFGVA